MALRPHQKGRLRHRCELAGTVQAKLTVRFKRPGMGKGVLLWVVDLEPGVGGTIAVTGVVSPGTSGGVTLRNRAIISSSETDGDVTNNTSVAELRIQPRAHIYLPLILKG